MSIDDDLYGQTYQQLLAKIVPNGANFQLLTPMVPWNWPPAPSGQIDPATRLFIDQVPEWSATGSYAPSGRTFSNSYQSILAYVDNVVPPAQQQQAKDAHDALVSANNQYNNDLENQDVAWRTMLNNLPTGVPEPDFVSWAASSGWTATLAADTAAALKAQQTYTSIVAQQNANYQLAANAILPPAKGVQKPGWTLTNQGDGNIVPVPNWIVGSTGTDWIDQLSKGGNPTSVSLAANKGGYDWTSSWASGEGEAGVGWFFSAYVRGSWQQMSIAENDSSVNVQLGLKASAFVPVQADPGWYDGAYLKLLAENPDSFTAPYTPTGGSSPIFGQGGVLPLIITGLVVGYQPSYTITMSSSTFNSFSSQYQAAGGLRIGPWVIGSAAGGSAHDTWNADSATNTFTGTSNATYPFVLGYTVARPGLD